MVLQESSGLLQACSDLYAKHSVLIFTTGLIGGLMSTSGSGIWIIWFGSHPALLLW